MALAMAYQPSTAMIVLERWEAGTMTRAVLVGAASFRT
ncbi:hypothetical protein CEV31_1233 [Brucella thiophenivorans]|uniref:Uncharacterized protein n=1 Tax=Brucella thiophenivorans TaxID=571255 RepID=A0A256FY88_9HYPH|nr:hypothetical protein CEV31_1233 [Brucella thiophenivorans]